MGVQVLLMRCWYNSPWEFGSLVVPFENVKVLNFHPSCIRYFIMGVLNPVPLNTLIKIYSNLVVHMIYLTIGVWNRIRWFGSWYVDRHNSITFHAWYLLIYIIYHGSVIKKTYIFSSPELKAQVSFSDHLSSVVCLSVCLSVCL